jgi:hypothetical protein
MTTADLSSATMLVTANESVLIPLASRPEHVHACRDARSRMHVGYQAVDSQ